MKKIIFAALIWLSLVSAQAGNDLLAQASATPLGERISLYLQNMMLVKSAIWAQYHPAEMDYREDLRLAVTYEPGEKLIGVSVIGIQEDPVYAQAWLGKIQKTLLSFGKKIKEDYGVDLTEGDFSLAYLNVRTGKIVLRMKEGQSVLPEPTPTP